MRAVRRKVVVLGSAAAAAALGAREDIEVAVRPEDLPGAAVVVLAGVPAPARLATSAPDAVVVLTGEPAAVDACLDATLLPRGRVLGLGALAASARWRRAVARAAGVSPRDVTALLLDDGAVASVAAVPAAALLGDALPGAEAGPADEHEDAAAIAEVVAAVLDDTRRVLPLALRLHGELGRGGHAAVVPVVVGAAGAEAVLELPRG